MSKGKWGESFLKSGLPLEHLTQVTFHTLGWDCNSQVEYSRRNRENQETWFELDLTATFPKSNRDTELSFLIECKYHDLSRFWFFLPHEPSRWHFNDRVLNCAPLQTLKKPSLRTMLDLAPASTGGIVVSEDGAKQDNAAYTAIQQLVNGYVPCSLSQMFSYNIDFHNVLTPEDELDFVPHITALIPMIVTNASIYRLRPDVIDLEIIREASAPSDIANEIEWTWCYHDPSMSLFDQNMETVEAHKAKEAELVYRFPFVENWMYDFANRPNWIAIVNIKALSKVATIVAETFMSLDTHSVKYILNAKPRKRRKSQQ